MRPSVSSLLAASASLVSGYVPVPLESSKAYCTSASVTTFSVTVTQGAAGSVFPVYLAASAPCVSIELTSAASLPTPTASPESYPTGSCGTDASSTPTVSLKNGTVEGFHIPSYNQDAFLGIPFAEAPVGDRRFRTPHYLENGWESPFEAKTYPPKCVGYGSEQIGNFSVAEDCLYLNVVRPSCAEQDLPVAVWIYGGGKYSFVESIATEVGG